MSKSKIVRTQAKGMVTIPVEFRNKLNLNEHSILKAELIENGVRFVKVDLAEPETEIYSDQQVERWLKEDKIDPKTVRKIEKLLKS